MVILDDTNNIENKSNDGAKETMVSAIALIQDTGGKKDITSNKNKKGNGNTLDDINSGNKDKEVDKTGNDNVGRRLRRKGDRKKLTTKKKKRMN